MTAERHDDETKVKARRATTVQNERAKRSGQTTTMVPEGEATTPLAGPMMECTMAQMGSREMPVAEVPCKRRERSLDRVLTDRIRREFFARSAAAPMQPSAERSPAASSGPSVQLGDRLMDRHASARSAGNSANHSTEHSLDHRRRWFGDMRPSSELPRLASNAVRYGVLVDDVLKHLENANLAATPGPARVLSFLDDLVLAAACVRGHPRAWQDAWQRHEWVLLRAARMRLEESDAVLFTRRYWIDLHAATVDPTARRFGDSLAPLPSIEHYVGVRPLRVWLTDRLMGRIENETRRRGRGAPQVADHVREAFASGRILSVSSLGAGDRRMMRVPLEQRLRLVD